MSRKGRTPEGKALQYSKSHKNVFSLWPTCCDPALSVCWLCHLSLALETHSKMAQGALVWKYHSSGFKDVYSFGSYGGFSTVNIKIYNRDQNTEKEAYLHQCTFNFKTKMTEFYLRASNMSTVRCWVWVYTAFQMMRGVFVWLFLLPPPSHPLLPFLYLPEHSTIKSRETAGFSPSPTFNFFYISLHLREKKQQPADTAGSSQKPTLTDKEKRKTVIPVTSSYLYTSSLATASIWLFLVL